MDNELKQIIESLLAAGFTEKYLAEQAGCSQPTINRIKNGDTDPSYSIGSALKSLHAEHFKAA